MSETQQPKPIYNGRMEKRTIEVDAEITEKGKVFILLPKSRFDMHRDNVERYMFMDKEGK